MLACNMIEYNIIVDRWLRARVSHGGRRVRIPYPNRARTVIGGRRPGLNPVTYVVQNNILNFVIKTRAACASGSGRRT